jgi:SAM-dependent methyltransferase
MTGQQGAKSSYVIRGGALGRERLRLLSAVMRPYALDLFSRLGIREGMSCLDVGCGGGDVSMELARIVGAGGKVVGTDLDDVKLEIARGEAREQGLSNVEFRLTEDSDKSLSGLDFVFARFLLTHVSDPAGMLRRMCAAARPGGLLAVVDIDFSGYFCYPDCAALWRYVGLYSETVRRRGGDANIGARLPHLLSALQLDDLQMNVIQPAGWVGGVKQMSPLTMEYVGDAVVSENLASPREIEQIVSELYAFAERPDTLLSGPRCFEVWGRKPA